MIAIGSVDCAELDALDWKLASNWLIRSLAEVLLDDVLLDDVLSLDWL